VAVILVTEKGIKKDKELPAKIDRAVFPGLQGGPHINTIAAIAVCLEEADGDDFKKYAKQIVKNAKSLEKELRSKGVNVFGTENHLMLLDFSDFGGGAQMALALEEAGIITNKNQIPGDKYPPFYPSGVRIGTPAVTTRGLKEKDMAKIAAWIYDVAQVVRDYKLPDDKEKRRKFISDFKETISNNKKIAEVKKKVTAFSKKFPLYSK
jgi:glycine hydroxymethyltransferase